ncbi:DUF305 domain-containing protein [Nesterenkonia sphaerica]|uniref:DUF305 domain-containing protein n=1 Tax=Nesterenkonia sphaerica TaxID=1804988 RepID=A0A5R9A638_9MICC|nr:DUF305 domain-containing protein [Nesterenkonia sphaerica]TLP74078.1 DUF305 domain-containing protein [Nesterenkonia sphaerica]
MKSPASAALIGILTGTLALVSCGEADQEAPDTGAESAPTADTTDEEFNDADIEYVSGMIAHHEQAVEMSDILLNKDDVAPDVAALAHDIRQAQQPEIDQMESWMESWGHAADAEHGGHGDASDAHHGMMSDEDLEELESSGGEAASQLFLEQMIAHHEGAVTMAEDHLQHGHHPEALELSEDVIADQTAEIEQMEEMLKSD